MILHTQGPQTIDEIPDRDQANRYIGQTLRQFGYTRRNRADKGVLHAYLMMATGLSRAQITRWIRQYRETGGVRDASAKLFG